MNKGQLIGGVICFAVGVLLAVLILTLPEGKVVFMLGDSNLPWVPALALVGIGGALIVTSWRKKST